MAGDEGRLRQDSDELLDAVDELRRMERAKRTHDISSPEFHALADRIESQARRVFDVAAHENEEGDALDRMDTSIDEVSVDGSGSSGADGER